MLTMQAAEIGQWMMTKAVRPRRKRWLVCAVRQNQFLASLINGIIAGDLFDEILVLAHGDLVVSAVGCS
jgi:hypothetical protein